MSFDIQTLELDDITRAQKENVRLAESLGIGSVHNTEKPLAGVVSKQNNRNKNIGDILDIGSGTRCTGCGLLHFMWVEDCSACKKPMEYNLGNRNEEARL
tara:strand:- start:2658 stop:2957 length:300 start_codon:yes stop_codon:yes gene_type:complete